MSVSEHVCTCKFKCIHYFKGYKKEKKKALSPAAVLENLRHTLVDYQNRCSNASVEVRVERNEPLCKS